MRGIRSWIACLLMAMGLGTAAGGALAQTYLTDEGEPGIAIWNAPPGTEIAVTLKRDGEVYCTRSGIVPEEPNAAGGDVFTLCRIADADFGGLHTWEVVVTMHGQGGSISSGRIQMQVDEVPGGCFPSVRLGAPATIIVQQACG